MRFHLQYRLWNDELNFDINVLRILGDHLVELKAMGKDPDVKARSEVFEKKFQALRTEIDEIRHEMHIVKMKLGANARDSNPFNYSLYNRENHAPLKKRLSAYKADFRKVKKDLRAEAQYLT